MSTISAGQQLFHQVRIRRGLIFGAIIIAALFAFEIFNYSTTEFALSDLLGDLKFAGIHWATILSIAFCGIDFAGIARLFTPPEYSDHGDGSPNEVWYLFGAWLLAATMNAMLTWWGVSLAVLGHETLGNAVISRTTLIRVVPIFVALLVWLIRVLIIGTFSVAGDHIFSQQDARSARPARNQVRPGALQSTFSPIGSRPQSNRSIASAPASYHSNMNNVSSPSSESTSSNRQEPTYHPLSARAPGRQAAATHSESSRISSSYKH